MYPALVKRKPFYGSGEKMEKQKADKLIEKYFQKIYGFAAKKAFTRNETDEIAAEIIKEVYLSFLKLDDIVNVEGYVWRISSNTFARYVASRKKNQGVSLDGLSLPCFDEHDFGDAEEDLKRLRREVAFLTETRRSVVYSFYYLGKSISKIARETGIPQGTVKWHLNKARIELKENFSMERKIGNLGLSPVKAVAIGHDGTPGNNGGPEHYLNDTLSLNIVYSVYWKPKTITGIAEELGITPVFIEDKVNMLEANGFLVKTKGNSYTTYVHFSPQKESLEVHENLFKTKVRIVNELIKNYVPKVREAISSCSKVYVPSGNRELFEASALFFALTYKCKVAVQKEFEQYHIKPLDGGDYVTLVYLPHQISDSDYKATVPEMNKDYGYDGIMVRESRKYKVTSWCVNSRLSSRKGGWENNLVSDYEYLYEIMTGAIKNDAANKEKFERLQERSFLTKDNKINVMVIENSFENFYKMIPELDQKTKDLFADYILEQATENAKNYPPQMQDFEVSHFMDNFISASEGVMLLDKLYDNGTFRPLSETEKITSQLLVFSDVLPK
jgi:RNA polymerase sigma factor (sigma-70 family)